MFCRLSISYRSDPPAHMLRLIAVACHARYTRHVVFDVCFTVAADYLCLFLFCQRHYTSRLSRHVIFHMPFAANPMLRRAPSVSSRCRLIAAAFAGCFTCRALILFRDHHHFHDVMPRLSFACSYDDCLMPPMRVYVAMPRAPRLMPRGAIDTPAVRG